MKIHPFLLAGLCTLVVSGRAQVPPPEGPPPSESPAAMSGTNPDAPLRTSEQLEQLLGPIALYPDALIALILPAATNASDVVLASRFLAANNDAATIDGQSWDESVKSLSRYPEVVKWMDENLEWTKQVGEAFTTQPTDVMNAVQRLRAEARAAGTLVDTPQQQVVAQNDAISIVPAEPDVIYVPRYDPEVVYVPRSYGYAGPFLTFGIAYPVGAWLSFDCDWQQRRIWIDHRYAGSPQRRDFRRPPSFPVGPNYSANPNLRPWHPAPNFQRPRVNDSRPPREIVRPVLLPGTPARPPGFVRDGNGNNDVRRRPNTPEPVATPNVGRNRNYSRPRVETPEFPGSNPSPGAVAKVPSERAPAHVQIVPNPAIAGAPAPDNVSGARGPRNGSRDREDRTATAPNFRAGAMERPRTTPPPAPGIPLERTPSAHRETATLAPAYSAPPPPAARSSMAAPAASSPAPSADANARESRASRDGRQFQEH